MRTIRAVLSLVLLVAGVAIRGATAHPVADPTATVLRCRAEGPGAVECRPLEGPLSAMVEEGPGFDFGGGFGGYEAYGGIEATAAGANYGEPDRITARALAQFVKDALDFALRAYDFATAAGLIGGMAAAPSVVADRLFDPQ
jgi:hypothetical protein